MVGQFLFIGTTELLLIGGMALLLFGGKKLPEMMRGLGQGVREFKKGVKDIEEDVEGDGVNVSAEEDNPQTLESKKDEKVEKSDGKQ